MSLPTSLAYMQKPSAVASRSMRSSIAPKNGASFRGSDGQPIILEIPTGISGTYLNPSQTYLKFSVTVSTELTTPATTVKVDESIYSIFDRLTVQHAGVVLEQIDQYGVLANALLDFQCSSSQMSNDLNVMLGTTAPANLITGAVGGIPMTSGVKTWFSMPILSSFFSMLGDRYIPLGDIRNELRIDLTLAPQGFIKTGTGALTYVVENIELMCDIVELDPAVASAIRRETLSRDGAFKIPMVQWRSYNTSIPISTGAASVIIPAKMNSLKNLLVIQRNQDNIVTPTLSKNERVNGVASYWFQVGSHYVPAKPVNHVFEAYTELQRSFHDLSIGNGDSVINRDTFSNRKYMIGLELESMSHRSDVLNSGLNSTSLNIYFNPTFEGTTGETRRVDTFAHFDCLLLIDPTGQMNIVF